MHAANIFGLKFSFKYFLQGWIYGLVLFKSGFVMEYLIFSIYDDWKFLIVFIELYIFSIPLSFSPLLYTLSNDPHTPNLLRRNSLFLLPM